VEFRVLLNGWREHRIFTHKHGFKQIKQFQKIKTGPTKRVKTCFGELICDPKHRLLTTNGSMFVEDIDETVKALIGYDNVELGFLIEDGKIEDLYDIEIDAPHWYYTSGLVSHNSIALVNSGAASILHDLNVLHVTLEMPKEKVAQRYMGCFTDEWIRARFDNQIQSRIRGRIDDIKNSYKGRLCIVEYPPNDISIDVVHSNCDVLRKMYGFNVDVIIIDYLELLLPRAIMNNDKDYNSQKRVSTELSRLAKKENALVFSAMQTNRDGNENLNSVNENRVIELNKVAESYGKLMPVDYLVTINQNKQEYEEGKETETEDAAITKARCRFYVAKNRNGPKFKTISAQINYETMKMTQHDD
jgi:hypothetical protein